MRGKVEWLIAGACAPAVVAAADAVVYAVLCLGPLAACAEPEVSAEDTSAILDTYSYWRAFPVFRPVLYADKAEGAVIPDGQPRTDAPPSGWASADFDDSRWYRCAGPVLSDEPGSGGLVSLVCLRGKFAVPDPAKVESLSLSAEYRGGIVVYLNGKEAARRHIAGGPITADTPAQEYPSEAYLEQDGKSASGRKPGSGSESQRRSLDNVSIPRESLRKGVNVLAVELHRAPLPADSQKQKRQKGAWSPNASIGRTRLAATPGGSVTPNTGRPKGIQVWNESVIADVFDLDYGDPNEPLRPIEMVGVRNGSFSGQVVVSSDAPLEGLQAVVSELKAPDGKGAIPAGKIRLLYPQPTGRSNQSGRSYAGIGRPGRRFDALAESPPATVPVLKSKAQSGHTGPVAVFGAVQPVRVTVEVPSSAAAGAYEGRLALKAAGLNATEVPVRIKVIDWTLPDSTEFSSHLGIVQSIDSLALYYKVPMWSDRHWRLIDRSFGILGRAGVDALYVPLVMKHHWGKESLVRWVKSDGGGYTHDFSILDKYLDIAFKHLKKPEVVCLYAWVREYISVHRSRGADQPPPNVPVPLLDRKSGEVSELAGPPYNSKEAAAFWKPVIEGCRDRLKKRGIADEAMVIGLAGDTVPDKETLDMFQEVAPWAKWAGMAHRGFDGARGSKGRIEAGYGGKVWLSAVPDPAKERRFGWRPAPNTPRIWTVFPRAGSPLILREETDMVAHWVFQETYMMIGVRGVSRIGAEFWPVVSEGKSKMRAFVSLYDTPVPTMDCAVINLLAPGPDGALSTARLETLYEGSQEAEARAFIEKALQAHRVKPEAGVVLQDILDVRPRVLNAYKGLMDWYAGSGWEERSERIYEAAAQVEKALGSK